MILHQCFRENHVTLNPGKCHYMVIGSGYLSHEIMQNNSKITSSNEKKILGIFLDSRRNFESHIASLCREPIKNKCLRQVKELLYIRSKKFTT